MPTEVNSPYFPLYNWTAPIKPKRPLNVNKCPQYFDVSANTSNKPQASNIQNIWPIKKELNAKMKYNPLFFITVKLNQLTEYFSKLSLFK